MTISRIPTERGAQEDYIRTREMEHILRLAESDSVAIARMYKMLAESLDELSADMEHWVASYASDYGITIQEANARAKAADIERLAEKARIYVANRHDRELAFSPRANKEMRLYNLSMKMSRAELLQNEIRLSMVKIAGEQAGELYGTLSGDAKREIERMSGLLGTTVPPPAALKDTARVIAISSFHDATFSTRIWNNSKAMGEILEQGFRKSLIQGKNPRTWMEDMTQFLADAKHQGEYNIERLVLTELSRVRNEAKRQSYERAGYASYKVLCVSDPCDICQKHDGEIYKLEDMTQGENAPTFHPNCRCTIVSAGLSDDELEKLCERYYEEEKRQAEEGSQEPAPNALEELNKAIQRLGANPEVDSEKNRAKKHKSSWVHVDFDSVAEEWGVNFESAALNRKKTKILLDTNRKDVKFVVSLGGGYFRIWDCNIDPKDPRGYHDLEGIRGKELLRAIRGSLDADKRNNQSFVGELAERRTHFAYGSDK